MGRPQAAPYSFMHQSKFSVLSTPVFFVKVFVPSVVQSSIWIHMSCIEITLCPLWKSLCPLWFNPQCQYIWVVLKYPCVLCENLCALCGSTLNVNTYELYWNNLVLFVETFVPSVVKQSLHMRIVWSLCWSSQKYLKSIKLLTHRPVNPVSVLWCAPAPVHAATPQFFLSRHSGVYPALSSR